MIGLSDLEVYNSIFNINETNDKFELCTDVFDEFSFEELKNELEEIVVITNFTEDYLEDERLGPHQLKTYWELRSEKSSNDVYVILSMGYARSPFRDFESYLRIVIGLDENDIQLILKQYNAKVVTYDINPGNYTIEDPQKAVYPLGDHEGTLQAFYDELNKKTKPILTGFGSTFRTLRFDEKSFFNTLLGFTAYWDFKPTNAVHADSLGVYISDKSIVKFEYNT